MRQCNGYEIATSLRFKDVLPLHFYRVDIIALECKIYGTFALWPCAVRCVFWNRKKLPGVQFYGFFVKVYQQVPLYHQERLVGVRVTVPVKIPRHYTHPYHMVVHKTEREIFVGRADKVGFLLNVNHSKRGKVHHI
jgi:hypothetical protein